MRNCLKDPPLENRWKPEYARVCQSMPASSFQNRLTTNIAFLAQFSSEEEGLVASSPHHHNVMIILSL